MLWKISCNSGIYTVLLEFCCESICAQAFLLEDQKQWCDKTFLNQLSRAGYDISRNLMSSLLNTDNIT